MEVLWRVIEKFPTYAVSNYGEVVNESTGRSMKPTRNTYGILKIGLVAEGKQYTKSIKTLVAEAFIEGRDDIHDTVIQLDGNEDNVRADNLMWRPRWFAMEYTKQFEITSENDHFGPLRELNSGIEYLDVYEAGVLNGLLFRDVRRSFIMKESVFPTLMRFELI